MIDESEKKVIGLIQGDLPLDSNPFARMAEKAGMSEGEFIQKVNSLIERGVIRRFGATLRHQEAGFSANAMVAWVVPEERAEEVGRIMAGFKEVSHCYQRAVNPRWRYNLFAMIHGYERGSCREIVDSIARETGLDDFCLLFSTKEFKKARVKYTV